MKPSEILTRRVIEPQWIVRDMIPRDTMVILAGEAGAGKSTLCTVLSYAVALGRPFLEHPTVQTRVLYFDDENGEPDFLKYHQWAWAGLGCPDPELIDPWFRIEHFSLTADWKSIMARAVREHIPGLVIVDTASSAFHLLDENDNAEASRTIQTLRHIRQLGENTTFIVLKHEKQRDDLSHRRTVRGAKIWLGAFDQVIYHLVERGRPRKDGTRRTRLESGKLRAYGLRSILHLDPVFTQTEPNGLIFKVYSDNSGAESDPN